MNEGQWMISTDVPEMLRFRGRGNKRKLRLFAVACCRPVWHWLSDPRCWRAVEAAEKFADGLITEDELAAARAATASFAKEAGTRVTSGANAAAYAAVCEPAWEAAWRAREYALWHVQKKTGDPISFGRKSSELFRDIFVYPSHPVSINPAWRNWHNGLVVSMAQQMYKERRFGDLPILADALEEAGCSDDAILTHCRQPGEHVRGCWVIDLILDHS
jgi:hypothetical protein